MKGDVIPACFQLTLYFCPSACCAHEPDMSHDGCMMVEPHQHGERGFRQLKAATRAMSNWFLQGRFISAGFLRPLQPPFLRVPPHEPVVD